MPSPRSSRASATLLAGGLVAAALALAPAPMAGAATSLNLPAPASGRGITVVDWDPVDLLDPVKGQVWEVDLKTPAIFQPGPSGAPPSFSPLAITISVRILFPADYTTNPARRDVLYLLHGGSDNATSYTTQADFRLKDTVAASPFKGIVVTPEGGRVGWYTNWHGETDGHFAPQWETFHVDQLVPWIDANFRTKGTRAGRAIAGISMGGLGTLGYAGRRPDVFGAVGVLSGGTDISDRDAQQIIDRSMWTLGAAVVWEGALNGKFRVNNWGTGSSLEQRIYRMQTVFGPPITKTDANGNVIMDNWGQAPRLFWPTMNPVEMATTYNAFDDRLVLYAGHGEEQGIGNWNDRLHNLFLIHGVQHRYCTGPGSHSWPFWQRDFVDFLQYTYGTTPTSCTQNAGWSEQVGPVPGNP